MAQRADNASLLHTVVIHDSRELLVDMIAAERTCVFDRDPFGRGALHDAAFQGRLECLRILLESGGERRL